ncbi:MAG TPA: acetate/propionate family kinase [Candidatus Marinimicrobia bacterium]|nr:MAG: acetate kinase [Candidatus Marinimicrobia bacterium CG1_02_48_14]HCW76384.1 acetate/propionate family kinase [Candidatus Neomarinimicrobiota bacterium]
MKNKAPIKSPGVNILAINSGSSSIKFSVYRLNGHLERILDGNVDRIGLKDTRLDYNNLATEKQGNLRLDLSDHKSVANFLIGWLEEQLDFSMISGIGHRVVFGMKHTEPEIITQKLLDELHRIIPYDSDHLPEEIELIHVFRQRYPNLKQVACFDTAFHSKMPRVAKLLPIPRRFDTLGIQRYGFHGLSYAYLMAEFGRVAGKKVAQGRVVLAHLGSGASMVAVHKGKSMDTSMGFTPAGGLMMGTRSGDLDPGVAWFMMKSENLSPKQFNTLINHESGLLGISETSSDMQDLLESQTTDIRAAEAVELFCYQVKKWIGAFAAVLGGLDTLVFSGGMGENAPEIRSRICEELGFLGIKIDEKRNKTNAPVISTDKGITAVRVIHTDEEWMIAKTVSQMLTLTKD